MKKTRKPLITAMCALVLALGVNATYAWLTDTTDTVTNTFTVGKVEITLDEAAVNEYGQKLNKNGEVAAEDKDLAERVTNNNYKLIPGQTYVKDPIVTVVKDSEACWLFVKVENGIAAIEDSAATMAGQIKANGWMSLDGFNGVYYKQVSADEASAGSAFPVFASFKIDGEKTTAETLAPMNGATVKVTAYAVQLAGFEGNASAAWNKVDPTA